MQDLRVKFGRTLGLALLPLLIFSIWQAWYNYNSDDAAKKRIIIESARTAISEVIGTLNTTKSIISIGGQRMVPKTCQPVIKSMLSVVSSLNNIALSTSEEGVICEGKRFNHSQYIPNALENVTRENPFYIETVANPIEVQSTNQIMLTHAVYDGAGIYRNIVAIFNKEKVAALEKSDDLPEGMHLSLFNKNGGLIIGKDIPLDINQLTSWLQKVSSSEQNKSNFRNFKGQKFLALPSDDLELFIVASVPKATFFSWENFNPILSSIIPILSWMFALGAIWVTTSNLLLNPIRSMRSQLLQSQLGDNSVKISFKSEPTADIKDLANTFNDLNDIVEKQASDLTSSLHEKETLLREIHHRVKNNLQVIISLLNMQERKIIDSVGLSVIRESRYRIQAIALVHKALYESDTLRYVDMAIFLQQMTNQLSRALMLDRKNIILKHEINCPPVESEKAMPIALFVVEAITNAVKHGVPNGGEINVVISQDTEHCKIAVIDNGSNVLSDDGNSNQGTGKRLMAGFARQLSGEFKSASIENGYEAALICPISALDS